MGLRTPPAPPQPLPEFENMRRKVASRTDADAQGQQDALKRRFASMGNLNSGAAIKTQQLATTDAARVREDALSDVNAQEAAAQRQIADAQTQRDFASSEAEKQRAYGTAEREGSQGFSSGQAQIQRDFQKGQFDQTFAEDVRRAGVTEAMAGKEFNRDSDYLKRNWATAIMQSGDPGAVQRILEQIDSGAYGELGDFSGSTPQPQVGGSMAARGDPTAVDTNAIQMWTQNQRGNPDQVAKMASAKGANAATVDAIRRRLISMQKLTGGR